MRNLTGSQCNLNSIGEIWSLPSALADVVQVKKRTSANTVDLRLHSQMFIKMAPRLRAEGDGVMLQ